MNTISPHRTHTHIHKIRIRNNYISKSTQIMQIAGFHLAVQKNDLTNKSVLQNRCARAMKLRIKRTTLNGSDYAQSSCMNRRCTRTPPSRQIRHSRIVEAFELLPFRLSYLCVWRTSVVNAVCILAAANNCAPCNEIIL